MKNIDELYKDMLQNNEVTPPDSVWDKLSSRLSAEAATPTDSIDNTLSQSLSSSAKGSIKGATKLATWKTATIVAAASVSVTTAAIVTTADNNNSSNESTTTAVITTTPETIINHNTIVYTPSSSTTATVANTNISNETYTPAEPVSEIADNIDNSSNYNTTNQPTTETVAIVAIDTIVEENMDNNIIMPLLETDASNTPSINIDTIYIDSLKIVMQQMQTSVNITIPNLITPNHDNYNDCWKIQGIENYYNVHVVIVSQKGQIIYENERYDNSWCPNDIPDGTYFYAINIISHSYLKKGFLEIRSK